MAWHQGRPVGMTCVMDRLKDHALNTFFTGVLPEARGSGLSTALKAQHALSMRALGHHRLYTQNMDQNTPILAANDRLGFTTVPGFYAVGRSVTG
jgi:predicted GNAT superfamily acetyltransferase